MVGPVGTAILALSIGCILATRNSLDRGVWRLAWYVGLCAVASLLVHWTTHGVSQRASPMMLLDVAGLYAMGLWVVCRTDRPLWLYGLTAATALECVAHLAYVAGALSGNDHTLALNLLFLVQVGALVAGAGARPEEDLLAAFRNDASPEGPRRGGVGPRRVRPA